MDAKKETMLKGLPWQTQLFIRFRFAFVYVLGCYGFWIVGLPIWWKEILGYNGIEKIGFLFLFALSPLTVPFTLFVYTFIAVPVHGESIFTVVYVWALAATSFAVSWTATTLLTRWIRKRGSSRASDGNHRSASVLDRLVGDRRN